MIQPTLMNGRIRGSNGFSTFLEVKRTAAEAIIVYRDTASSVTLQSQDLEYSEIVDGLLLSYQYARYCRPILLDSGEPYPPALAARKLITGTLSKPVGFKNGSLAALTDVLPSGKIHLFDREAGLVGRFAERQDAVVVAEAAGGSPIIFGSVKELQKLPSLDLGVVLKHLDPERKWPTSLSPKHYQEIFAMAEKVVKKAPTKLVKAEAKQRRADGPVAKAREIFEKMKGEDTAKILAACDKAEVNHGTATTQLGRWRKENGIVVKRGGANNTKKKKPAKPAKVVKPKPVASTEAPAAAAAPAGTIGGDLASAGGSSS